jgi:hypothetical protein
LGVAAAVVIGPGPSAASHLPAACTTNQQQGTLCLVVSDTPDPVAYSTFDGNSTFISYHAVATNSSRNSSLSHVGVREQLPAGTRVVRVTTSRGTCAVSGNSDAGQSVDCSAGALKKGQEAVVDTVVTAPATTELNPADATITNNVSASFDERFSDQPNGGKVDTAAYAETTTVSKTAGQTFVPEGHSGKVDTDPAQAEYANASVPDASTDVLATIRLLAPDDFCIDGTVRVGSKTYVCRNGGFVDVSVVDAETGATYSNSQHPLVFHLRWNSGLVSDRQTVRNFVVFYQSTAASPVQVFDTRCNASASNTPCVTNIFEADDGGFSADLVKQDNGHMR